jgi:hypothetical protein
MTSALRQLATPMALIPAYGRTYATAAELREAWEAGKDFKQYGTGRYCSVRDLDALLNDCSSLHLLDVHSGARHLVG